MIIGFTGTRSGMSDNQKTELMYYLLEVHSDITHALHGGCIGADMDFHKEMGFCIREVYPGHSSGNPLNLKFRGDYEDTADVIHESQTHFKRNRDIVDRCDILIATPYTDHKTGGGTWYTIDYALKMDKPVKILKR